MSAHQATVEVLAAEVRVLMVGSRQVTLSVYRQLDTVSHRDCEPFGRVSDAKDSENGVYIVGRHRRSGDLVRAFFHEPPTRGRVFWDAPRWLPAWCNVMNFKWDAPSLVSGRAFDYVVAEDGGRQAIAHLPGPDEYIHASCGRRTALGSYRDGDCECRRWGPGTKTDGVTGVWHDPDSDPSFDAVAAMRELADGTLNDLRAAREGYDELRALPLIVLAGLR